jgi:hypothetical protein
MILFTIKNTRFATVESIKGNTPVMGVAMIGVYGVVIVPALFSLPLLDVSCLKDCAPLVGCRGKSLRETVFMTQENIPFKN